MNEIEKRDAFLKKIITEKREAMTNVGAIELPIKTKKEVLDAVKELEQELNESIKQFKLEYQHYCFFCKSTMFLNNSYPLVIANVALCADGIEENRIANGLPEDYPFCDRGVFMKEE